MGSCRGVFSLLFALCCPDASWAFCCTLLTLPGCVKGIVTVCTSQTCCLRVIILMNAYVSRKSFFVGESWNSCKCALLALPLSYWDVLFTSLTSSPKPITF